MKNIMGKVSCSNEQSQNTMRSSNIELLRIIAMFMVVLGHYYVKGGFPDDSLMTTSKLVMQFLGSWSKIAVDIFVIISGYFLVTQKFRWKKIWKFFGCTYFWSLATLCFVLFVLNQNVEKSLIMKAVNPITPLNWFARAYLVLYIAFPLINKMIERISKTQLGVIIAIFTTAFYVIPSIRGLSLGGYLNSFFMFADMYCIGAYLRLYSNDKFERTIKFVGGISAVVFYAIILVSDYLGGSDPYYTDKHNVMYHAFVGCSILGLLMAVALFVVFKNWHLPYNAVINSVATTTFAVYLIHDNGVISAWLWNDIVRAGRFYDTIFLIPHMILTAMVIFAVCSLMEFMREKLFSTIKGCLSRK